MPIDSFHDLCSNTASQSAAANAADVGSAEEWDESAFDEADFRFPRYVGFDLEIHADTEALLDIGAIDSTGKRYHGTVPADFRAFCNGAVAMGGHNVVAFDTKRAPYLFEDLDVPIFDTLLLGTLLFPQRRRQALDKDEVRRRGTLSNPLNDAERSVKLLPRLVSAWWSFPLEERRILADLLGDVPGYTGFFRLLGLSCMTGRNVVSSVRKVFAGRICCASPIERFASTARVELAYALAFGSVAARTGGPFPATPYWVTKNYPKLENVLKALYETPCSDPNCEFCHHHADVREALQSFFGYPTFRVFEGDTESLQEKAAIAAVEEESLLAIFPTGGGKSITFQVPALMAARKYGGLTVVITPLLSLMMDQVENLAKKDIWTAVTINGMLQPLERKAAFEEVESGRAALVYLAPETLRTNSVIRALESRRIERFVIDEAHCFSAWGHDFRVDYQYIGDAIRMLEERTQRRIPVSCFTATAKAKVVQDICDYFQKKLGVTLRLFTTRATRRNLLYRVTHVETDEEKYRILRGLLETHQVPTIVYTLSTKNTEVLAERLTADGLPAKFFHGKMEPPDKQSSQAAFMSGQVRVMVATTAFGMGVDKSDVGLVVHYDISGSLENYVQESGRAGRDPTLDAECHILFNERDLDRHFSLLASSKLSLSDVQQVWRAIKTLSHGAKDFAVSKLEIVREAGWDVDNRDIETKVAAAVAALETAGYVKRRENVARVYATGLLQKSYDEGARLIDADWERGEGSLFKTAEQKRTAERVLNSLVSRFHTSGVMQGGEGSEARVDYLADRLGLERNEVMRAITNLRMLKILTNDEDMCVMFPDGLEVLKRRLEELINLEAEIVRFLQAKRHPLWSDGNRVDLYELNQAVEDACGTPVGVSLIKRTIRTLKDMNWLEVKARHSSQHWSIELRHSPVATESALKRQAGLARRVIEILGERCPTKTEEEKPKTVPFALLGLLRLMNDRVDLFDSNPVVKQDELEKILLILHRNNILKLDGGFFVRYQPMRIERIVEDNRRRYRQQDYATLNDYYKEKIRQIHIVGEYANLMMRDFEAAKRYVQDYFRLPYEDFVKQYFGTDRKKELERNMTPGLYQKLIGTLSEEQQAVLFSEAQHIVVAAGPGSGKTRVLVHKLAHLMLDENVRPEQLLMLTFSRAAATEFKIRLIRLYGNAARFVTIRTFHSYAFDVLGRPGSLDQTENIVLQAVEAIRERRVEPAKITATALVLDEAQDMREDEFALVKALIDVNDGLRVVAVGDDDQNIYAFRGSDSRHFASLKSLYDAEWYELRDNWRSCEAIVETANRFVEGLANRMKSHSIRSVREKVGNVTLIRYHSRELTSAVAKRVAKAWKNQKGHTAVLVPTNNEAYTIYGLLSEAGIPAQLVRGDRSLRLGDLYEAQHLTNDLRKVAKGPLFDEEDWERALAKLRTACERSIWYGSLVEYVKRLRKASHDTVFASDWEAALEDSRLEDLFDPEKKAVFVSTYHGAKGREFEHVHILLRLDHRWTDENKRALYVALTRAKDSLVVHATGDFLPGFATQGLERLYDEEPYAPPERIMLPLGHKDVWLSYRPQGLTREKTKAAVCRRFRAGDELTIKDFRGRIGFYSDDVCWSVVSKSFMEEKLAPRLAIGYEMEKAFVNAVIRYRLDRNKLAPEDEETEGDKELTALILPTIVLRRRRNV